MNHQTILGIVVPCYNEEAVLSETILRLNKVLEDLVQKDKISINSFMIFVDDGSKDNTWNLIENVSKNNKFVKGLKLSKNQGHQNALLAGMQFVVDKCDCLISLDADLQQDENSIEEFLYKYISGSDVVLGIRNDRQSDGFFKKTTALGFYKLIEIMGVHVIKNHADYRLLSNRANKSLMEFKEVNLFLRGLVPLLGYKTDYVYFDVKDRFAGESKYTLSKMLSFALDGITSFSVTPLRMISIVGFIVFTLSFTMSAYIIFVSLFTNKIVPGWASTVLPIYFLGGIQILSIGIVGEYIGKIYKETKKRPRFFIEKEV
ncbi:glycosyltransferase family 2 protein [Aliarcobacter cryaerophilus]|uniref:glycosyltransferase family 2 protein n=1 Tax=Aliarcobacter cryaerophilus TaxID=28198 RepID=UPI003DA56502